MNEIRNRILHIEIHICTGTQDIHLLPSKLLRNISLNNLHLL